MDIKIKETLKKIQSSPLLRKIEDDRVNFYDDKSVNIPKVIFISIFIFFICFALVLLVFKIIGFV